MHKANRSKVWTYFLNTPIDWTRYPILVMEYRALRTEPDFKYVLWIDDGTGPNGHGLRAWTAADVIPDGQIHILRRDLREAGLSDKGTITSMALGVSAADALPAELELISLRFEADPKMPVNESPADDPPMTVRVVGPENQPVQGATVVVDAERLSHARQAITDDAGLATLTPIATPTNKHHVRVTAPDMTRVEVEDFNKLQGDPVTINLVPTQTYSGSVVDEAGQPIQDAVVKFWVTMPNDNNIRRNRVQPTTTDQLGRWYSPPIATNAAQFSIQLVHMEYMSDRWGGQSGPVPMSKFADGSAVSVMKKGLPVTGTVLDHKGDPVPNANVAQGEDRFPSNAPPATLTDAAGRYHFKNTRPGPLVMTVTAEGYAPELIQTQAKADMAPVDFTLAKSHPFQFRVVDADGRPLKGIFFSPDTWRGFRTIPQSFETDADGLAVWDGPGDEVQFDLYARNYMRQEITTGPSSDENDITEIVMHGPLTITADVTDAETGEPVKDFHVVMGIIWQNDGTQKPYWQRDYSNFKPGKDGHWEHQFTSNYPYRVIRIEAQGYAPASSDPISQDDGSTDLLFKLQKAESLAGTLVNEQGDPLEGVSVYLAIGRSMPQIQNGRIGHSLRELIAASTDEQGRFSFQPQDDGYLLIALSDLGYAEMDTEQFTEAKGVIPMMPWVTVKGQLLVGDEPRAGEQVNVWSRRDYDPNKQRPRHDLKATTDENGYFVLDRVPAGPVGVGRHIQLSPRSWTTTNSERFDVLPGETIDVTIGGKGRPVVGRFIWPDGSEAVSFSYGHHSLQEKVEHIDLMGLQDELRPADFKTWDEEKQKTWLATDEGKQAIATLKEAADKFNHAQRNKMRYNFAIDPDGKFRIENVEPGTYQLTLQIHQPPPANQCGYGDPLAKLNIDVTVPALPDGVVYDDEPLDAGTHTLTMIKPAPQIGETSPDFTVPLLALDAEDPKAALENAEQLTLSDLTGKVVLLDFWATWCGPCVAETPNLKSIWDSFGDDDRFEMVALSLDQSPKAPTDYANKNDIAWTQAYLGEWGKAKVTDDYAVRGIPSIWLIGPDGRIVAKGLRGDGIRSAIEDALNNMPQ